MAAFVFIGALVPHQPVLAQAGGFVLQGIEVQGNRRIEAETIRITTDLVPGETVTARDVNDAVQALFATGLFSDARIEVNPPVLTVVVEENPSINQIAFEGNSIVSDDVLRSAIDLRPRLAFNRAAVESDAARIIDAYRSVGRLDAEVNPVIIERSDNRVDVVFEISEGDVTEVERITFVGNEVFSDSDLRGVIASRQAGLFSFLFAGDTFEQDRLRLDEELLRQFYLENGFAEFEVESAVAELSPDRDAFFITFTVSEGPRYTFGELGIDSFAPGLEPQDFDGAIAMSTGDGFDQRRIDDTIENMLDIAGIQGFAFVDIVPRVVQNFEERTVDVIFEVQEGDRVFVQRIDISGNTATLDRVIRREFELVEGDAFNARQVREATDRLRGLGYFGAVDVDVREGTAPDQAVIDATVEERLTGSINFGIAFSSASGLGGTVALQENNFLGRGQRVGAEFSIDSDRSIYSFSFDEPAFLDREVGVGFDAYFREIERETSNFDETNIGIEPRVSFPLSPNGSLQVRYRLSQDDIEGSDPEDVSQAIINDEGSEITSSIGATYAYDRRNSRAAPTAGYLLTLSTDLAGLGGDAQYLRNVARGRIYQSFRNDDIVTFLEVEGGALVGGDDGVRVTDRFFLGGQSFRGFQSGGLGPRDRFDNGSNRDIDSALGGNYYAVMRAQASFPLGLPEELGLFGGVFANVGTLWGLDDTTIEGDPVRGTFEVDDDPELRSAVGLSLFWDSPIGALRIDYAEAIQTEEGDDLERFRLTGGRRF
ncbi:outer membrane protein assembly factor BamA [Pontivivens ytuae]|uniref:Outer membrane protein assembly factor BamA n=1 Tax=Pontivivens ytuae TaxID=2789856 RepID=A0A7S9LRY9_9RHOB|nr:outer membrane protein assembly factor BamA [Pontivivens ytuae]